MAGTNQNNDFVTSELDLLATNREPEHANVPSGTTWAPQDLDTFRIATASGVREIRTGHGILQMQRNTDATAITFATTTFVNCVYNETPAVHDEDYYSIASDTTVTVLQEGIYRVSYTTNINISGETQARSGSTSRILINGVTVPTAGLSHGYHRLQAVDLDNDSTSFFHQFSAGDTVVCQSNRYAGGDILKFSTAQLNFERISPLRHPFNGGGLGD